MKSSKGWVAAAVVLGATATSAFAGTVNVSATGSTAAPPTTVGGFTMTAFGNDTRTNGGIVSTVDAPGGGTIGFSTNLAHVEVGNGWATWSHSYTGDVYYQQLITSLTITLPTNTVAFYLYAEPDQFGSFTMTAQATDGAVVQSASNDVEGNAGAERFEFWMSGGGTLASVSISIGSGGQGFAVGEFGIARDSSIPVVPLPPAAWGGLSLLGVLGLVRLRRRPA